ncbi:hypothetical protein [Candidatus Uabimicrobium amorphum]|uniref:Uncharacterized protein n=1 Tax=Uabimicrobium amorphum TaxID=2596890 RepID=A0A5S9IJH1_UABAM|nr:hypothetical protein [Candidatus Uabimicrobium amorphum]BBM82998.1 hypothetical protein UABAM_01341 [Candidatus Uabimicrobium amorphum]
MKAHYLHLVKLGITLKYVKKSEVDDLLDQSKGFEYSRLQGNVKKNEWKNMWRIYIENSITSLFVRHGLLDKKLFLVIIDDLIQQGKQKKAISGAMIAVQKNLLCQKIVDRAYHNILSKKIQLPSEIYAAFLKDGFLTDDTNLFGLDFTIEDNEKIEEVAPIEPSVKKDATIIADNSSKDDTQKIHYEPTQDMQENVSPQEDTIAMYKNEINYTQEVCKDLAASTAEFEAVSRPQRFSLAVMITIVLAIPLIYFLWPSDQKPVMPQQIKMLVAEVQRENGNTTKTHWEILKWYQKTTLQFPRDEKLRKEQLQLLNTFLEKALKKRQLYLANAIINEYKISLQTMLRYQLIDKEQLDSTLKPLQTKFNKAIKR